jgi:hypothetical protein
VFAYTEDTDQALAIIEDLELEGVPPESIELVGGDTYSAPRDMPFPRTVGSVARSVGAGIVIGLLVGGLLGLAAFQAGLVSDRVVGMLMGAVFGSAAGVGLGGIRAVRWASPAWRQAQQATATVAVAVEHPDPEVVDTAEDVMATHHPRRLDRHDR